VPTNRVGRVIAGRRINTTNAPDRAVAFQFLANSIVGTSKVYAPNEISRPANSTECIFSTLLVNPAHAAELITLLCEELINPDSGISRLIAEDERQGRQRYS
jgi:hypothetical protein